MTAPAAGLPAHHGPLRRCAAPWSLLYGEVSSPADFGAGGAIAEGAGGAGIAAAPWLKRTTHPVH
ncbi:hypothetical protein [Streptomyces sp. NPDC057418]|uniref:hypothetical protein n=1 Tax=Streptomyces sp. NPDC057418 TaxID=3346126 RepID=UPI0036B68DDA